MGWSDFFGGGGGSSNENWKTLDSEAQLDEIVERSKTIPVGIFKHSTRCSISSAAKSRLDRGWDFTDEEIEFYYLDLIQFRNVSNSIAQRFGVQHQSPQVIIIKNGQAVYAASHSDVRPDAVREQLAS